jgi:hypothetical protein
MFSCRKYDELRQKFIDGEPLNAGEATGDTISKMVREIDEAGNIGNPYSLSSIEIQHAHMEDIKRSIEEM